jgi:hypothetical protein
MRKHQPWLRGKIGYVERLIYGYLIGAKGHEASTGELARHVYQNPHFDRSRTRLRAKSEPLPPLKSWMYQRIRLSAPTFADRVGGGRGRKGFRWKLRDFGFFSDIRDQKTIAYQQRRARNRPVE